MMSRMRRELCGLPEASDEDVVGDAVSIAAALRAFFATEGVGA